jgi:hypothetical protein
MADQLPPVDLSTFKPLGQTSAPPATPTTTSGLPPVDMSTFKPLGGTSSKTEAPPVGVGEQIAQGFGSAAATGVAGLAKLGSHIPGVPQVANAVGDVLGLPKLVQQPGQPAPNPYDIVQKSAEANAAVAQKTTAGKAGALLENIAEFMAGEEGLKGLSEVERMRKLLPTMKLLQESPKLLSAAKAAMAAAQTGTVMGAQEAAHGGTAGQVATQAGVGAGLGIVGSALWSVGKAGFQALQKAGFSGAALDAATKIASENVKPAEEIADTFQQKLNNAESVMHTSFDNAMEDMRGKIGTEPVPLSGSPLHEAAVKLAAEAEHLPQGITAGLRGLVPAEGNMAGLLQGLTDGTVKDMTGSQLIDLRQQLSKQLPRVAPAIKQAVGDLLEGIDSTLDKMAGEAGNVEGVSTGYTAARGAYRQSIKDLKEPFVQRIRDGKTSDVLKAVMSGAQDAPYKVGVLKRLLGDDTVAAAGVNKFADIIKGATSDEGELSVKKAITEWDKLSDEAKKSMFSATPEVGQRLEQVMDGLRTIAKTRDMVKWGVGAAGAASAITGGYGIATGKISPTSAIETIAGLAGILGVARFGGGGELLEDLASNRKLLSGLGKLYGYSGENIVGRLGQGGTETAEQLAKRSAEGPALATSWDKIKTVAGNLTTGGEEGAVGNVTKRKAGEPGTSSLIGKRGVSAPPEAAQAAATEPVGQGGHAGGGVTSEEELSRPGKNYIVSKSGQLTYHGKSFAPEETPAGSAHVTVLPDGTFRTNEGTLTPAMEAKLRVAEPVKPTPAPTESVLGQAGKAVANQADDVVIAAKKAQEREPGRTEGVHVLPTEKVGGTRISQRNPTAIKATENPVNEDLKVGLDAIKKSDESKPGFVSKLAATVAKYPGVPISEELAQADPEKALNLFVNHISDNLQWLHNQIPENVRNISKLWYDSVHQLTKEWAAKYGVTHEQMAGAVAALSPQNEWNNNAETANRVADILKNKQNFEWSPEMQTKASQLAARSPDLGKVMQDVMGKKLSDLDNAYDKAAWIRVYDKSHNGRTMPNYAPDGSIRGLARNPVSQQPTTSHWNSTSGIAKAVSILEDGSKENIHRSLGDMHKVRNFYNNIIDPWSKSGDVTIDTHAVGAGHLRPMGGSSEEVMHNFGQSFKPTPAQAEAGMKASSSQGSAVTGVQGTYGLYAEAYRRAAAKLGILPRELQSITWEGIRALYESRAKTDELKSTISQIWKDHKNGEVSIDLARKQILKAAGGFKNPKWLSDIGQNGAEGATPKP